MHSSVTLSQSALCLRHIETVGFGEDVTAPMTAKTPPQRFSGAAKQTIVHYRGHSVMRTPDKLHEALYSTSSTKLLFALHETKMRNAQC
jgi:hypothetical protein